MSYSYFKSCLYNCVFGSFTEKLYKVVVHSWPENAMILDVGVGNGSSLCKYSKTLLENNIGGLCIDIDKDYLTMCQKNLATNHLDNLHAEFHDITKPLTGNQKFDFVYFSDCFPLLNDKKNALINAKNVLTNDGIIQLTMCIENRNYFTRFLNLVKPNLKYLLGVEFGTVTFRDDFEKLVSDSGLKINTIARFHFWNQFYNPLYFLFTPCYVELVPN